MKIAFNPESEHALQSAPKNNDITFDLKGIAIYAKGTKFKGTDTTYSVFKKHPSSDNTGGYDGLVPSPSYNNNSKNRFLREDGTWSIPSVSGKVSNDLILKINSGTTEGTSQYTYNGSAAKTLDIKAGSNITLTAAANALTIAASDTKVTQTNTTTNADYRVLFSGNANDTTETTTARKSANLLFNPSAGTLTAITFQGNLDGIYVNTLTGYTKATSAEDLAATDTLNAALGKLEYKADVAYSLVKGAYDGDGTIENLVEILKVLEGIKDTDTIQAIVGKYLPLTGGTLTGSLTIGDKNNNDFKFLQLFRLGRGMRINNTYEGAYIVFGTLTDNGITQEKILTLGDKGLRYSPDSVNYYDILHAGNYSSYLPFLNSMTTRATKDSVIYAPNIAGIDGNLLVSTETRAPTWTNTIYKKIWFDDNVGKPSYILISKVTSWYNNDNSTGINSGNFGIVGMLIGQRMGNMSGTIVQNIIAYATYSNMHCRLRTDTYSADAIIPYIVKYKEDYYIALLKRGSGRNHYFYGYAENLLKEFIVVQSSDYNLTFPDLKIIHSPEEWEPITSTKIHTNNTDYNILHTGNYTSYLGYVGTTPVQATGAVQALTGISSITSNLATISHLAGNQGTAIINSTAAAGAYTMLAKMNSTNGYFTQGVYGTNYNLQYTNKSVVDAGTNATSYYVTLLGEDGNSKFPRHIYTNGKKAYDDGKSGIVLGSETVHICGSTPNILFFSNQSTKSTAAMYNINNVIHFNSPVDGSKASVMQINVPGVSKNIDWGLSITSVNNAGVNDTDSGVGIVLGSYARGNTSHTISRGAGIAAVAEDGWYNFTGIAFYVNNEPSATKDSFSEKMRLSHEGHLIPKFSTTQTLGTSNSRWSNIYSELGNFSGQITSIVADGTAPFVVSSTTKVTNLNADLLDGYSASAFLKDCGLITADTIETTLTNGVYHTSAFSPPNVGYNYGSVLNFRSYPTQTQFYMSDGNQDRPRIWYRNKWNAQTIINTSWIEILTSKSYTNYTVGIDGTGATGTWGIDITGSAGSTTRIKSLGNKSASDLSSTYGDGLTTSGIYNNGWPFTYGCAITTNANGGVFQIAGQWNSGITGSDNYDYPTAMYIRGRRDSYDVWSTWTEVLTNRNSSVSGGGSTWGSSITVNIGGTSKTLTIPNKPTIPTNTSQLTNDSGFVTGGPYIPLSGTTGLTGSIVMQGDSTTVPFVRNLTMDITSGWARNIMDIQVDGSSKFVIGAFGSYTKGSSSNGITYAYLGCNSYDGLNLRIASDSLKWGGNTILHTGNWSSYITIPTKTSQLTNDSDFITSRGYIGTTSVQASSGNQALTGINNITTPLQGFTITTPSGNIQIGPQNTSGCHIYTNRDSFYFNKPIYYWDGSSSHVYINAYNYTSYTPILNSSSTHATKSSVIYAPTTSGNGGDILISDGQGSAPVWTSPGNVTVGGASKADKLTVARTIALSGAVTGSASFDGSANITIATSVNHTHSYLPLTGGTLTGSLTVGDKDANELISIAGNTSQLKMMAWTNATYIESGNSGFTGNVPLHITGYNANLGSTLYLDFNTITCRGSYTNIDSGNWSNYITIPTVPTLYERNLGVNGTNWTFSSPYNTATTTIYAPTSAGTSGYVLKSNGSGAPSWIDPSSLSVSYAEQAGSATSAGTAHGLSKSFAVFGVAFNGAIDTTVDMSTLIGVMGAGDSNITDSTHILTSHVNGFNSSGNTTTIYKRTANYLWNYIKGKIDSTYTHGASGGYIGTTAVQSTSQTQNLTGIGGITANSTIQTTGSLKGLYVYVNSIYGNTSTGMQISATSSIDLSAGDNAQIYISNAMRAIYTTRTTPASLGLSAAPWGALYAASGTFTGNISANGGSFYTNANGAYHTSDIRKKTNITKARNLDIADLLVEFDWKDSGKHSWGYIAQDLLEVLPEAVDYNEDIDVYSVNYNVAHSAAIASLTARIKELEEKLKKYGIQ